MSLKPPESSTATENIQDTHTTENIPDNSIGTLRQNPLLWYKLHVLVYDLRHFKSDTRSETRLNEVADRSYIGSPYFSDDESRQIKSIVVNVAQNRTLEQVIEDAFKQRLEKRIKTRMNETGDYKVCTAHDIGPIFEKSFNIRPKDLQKNKSFRDLVQKGGLELPQGTIWKGLGKKR